MTETISTELKKESEKFGIALSEHQLELFTIYARELIIQNEKTNLTAITDPENIMRKHFIDSLSLIPVLPKETNKLIDIGSGAGFPGLPIKIAQPNLHVTLIESVGKKIAFLEHIIKTLDLENIEAVSGRAEELGQDQKYREQYDIATARAVANLATLSEYALPFLKIGGIFIAQKILDENLEKQEEIIDAEQAIQILGGELQEIKPVEIAGLEKRNLIIIKKIKSTPEEYPRRIGLPLKKPL